MTILADDVESSRYTNLLSPAASDGFESEDRRDSSFLDRIGVSLVAVCTALAFRGADMTNQCLRLLYSRHVLSMDIVGNYGFHLALRTSLHSWVSQPLLGTPELTGALSNAGKTFKADIQLLLRTWELAVGVICSCLPVVFVTLKGMSKSGPWATFMKYIRSKDRHNGAYHSDGPLPLHHPTDDMPGDGKGLPQVPRGTMTGMRTFIRNVHHSKPSKSIVVTTELHSFTGLASIDDSYHAQLQNGYFESSYTNQSNPSQASVTGGPKWSGKRY